MKQKTISVEDFFGILIWYKRHLEHWQSLRERPREAECVQCDELLKVVE